MRNYPGLDYQKVLKLPLRIFWMLNAQVERLRAEENLDKISLHLLSNGGVTKEVITSYQVTMKERMGSPTVSVELPDHDKYQRGVAALLQINAETLRNSPADGNPDPISNP